MTETSTKSVEAVTLSDIDYSTATAPEVDNSAVAETITDTEQFFNCEQGDVLWIAGTEYVVIDEAFTILGKNPLFVQGEDGSFGKMVAGMVSDTTGGVTWIKDISECDSEDVSRVHLLAEFGDFYKLKSNGLEKVHEYLPDTDTRTCPNCEHESEGKPIRIEEQGPYTLEIRQCHNSDCLQAFRFKRRTPEPASATVLAEDAESKTTVPVTITGHFTCERQDDFKFPIDTNSPRVEGIYSAQEVADFINPKMVGDQYGVTKIKDDNRWGQDRLHIQWKDAKGYSANMRITFKRVSTEPETYWEAIRRVSGLGLDRLFS
jgi:hypothetical protein